MANPRIDDSLVNSLAGAVAAERMAKAVLSSKDLPPAVRERPLEMVVDFISTDRFGLLTP